MSDFHVALIALDDLPDDLGAVAALVTAVDEMDNEVWAGVFGHDDFATPPGESLTTLRQQDESRRRLLVAVSGPVVSLPGEGGLPQLAPSDPLEGVKVLGSARMFLPIHDNTHVMDDVEVAVRPDQRRRGIGRALAVAVESLARHHKVTTVIGWGTHRPPVAGRASLAPAQGELAIGRDAAAEFALSLGCSLAQCDQHATLTLSGELAAAPQVHPGHELLCWEGATPEELLEGSARLRTAFAADLPKGELDVGEEQWTAARLRDNESESLQTSDRLTVTARHRATGELVGTTFVTRRRAVPGPAWQGVTLVLRASRGLGLGLALKQELVCQLQQRWPETRRIHTWNAGENRWMLAVNEQLGYVPETVGAAWQRKLSVQGPVRGSATLAS